MDHQSAGKLKNIPKTITKKREHRDISDGGMKRENKIEIRKESWVGQ